MIVDREEREPERCPYCGRPAKSTSTWYRGADVWVCDACVIRYGIVALGEDEDEQGKPL